MDAYGWAHEQFWGATLPDVRLRRRLVEIASCIRANPCGTLPRAIPDAMALKGAYRLFRHSKVTHQRLLEPHVTCTRAACRQPGEYLLIEDTTSLSFTQRGEVAGMGPLTSEGSQGLLAHTCLAARIEHWSAQGEPEVTLAGVFGQECWTREKPQGTRAERKKAKRKKTGPCESARWGRAIFQAPRPPAEARWSLLADRECDIFDVLVRCFGHGVGWVVRVAYPRKTAPSAASVFETAALAPLLGGFMLPLRARPGVAARQAHLEVRAIATVLCPPGDRPADAAPLPTGLVEVREIDPPEGVSPVHWLLFTSWPCATFAQARRVVGAYACRWLIEEYHKALKTGTGIEDSQLSTESRIEALLAIHTVVAADLLQLKLLARTRPDEAIDEHFLPPEALTILEARGGRPSSGWTNATLLIAIARMGGYLARKHDGPPGWLSIWHGMIRLMLMTDGYLLAIGRESYGQ